MNNEEIEMKSELEYNVSEELQTEEMHEQEDKLKREETVKRLSSEFPSAVEELNLFYKDSDSWEKEMVMHDVLQLLETFSKQGHSGISAPFVLNLFTKLAKHQILTPLMGEDEFVDIEQAGENGFFQNRRDSRVFKRDGKYWFIEGKVFIDQNGCSYTNQDSFVEILSFPYTPTTEYINVVNEDRN